MTNDVASQQLLQDTIEQYHEYLRLQQVTEIGLVLQSEHDAAPRAYPRRDLPLSLTSLASRRAVLG